MRMRNFRGNIFVANLPRDFTEERLAETFDPYGIVLSASIARDPETGKQLRHGFVDIATERAANLAIAALDGTTLDGCRLSVRVSERKAAAKPPVSHPGRRPPPRRPTTRPDPAEPEGAEPAASYALPRPQRNFTVERRPLPRRIVPSAAR